MSQAATHTTGTVLGWVIVAGYLLAVMKYFVRLIYQKVIVGMTQDSWFREKYLVLTRPIIRVHGYVGLYLLTIIVLHSLIELLHQGFFLSGVIVASLMTLQIFLGAYGMFVKGSKKGFWLDAHRALAALLSGAIVVHILAIVSFWRGPNYNRK